ncbi:uncharacterized protein LOC114463075 isoform X3 [Gouania willdenowi]|uniref:uncharacterized protein LOC114463075 isoform X3 n=1 Tax=Gouania willdenowi TaxID=441366 RepID=UPI00105624BB|nr:uncharacterized protein LOC114463075 isoform X3 [Gouania willdenowi]
MSTVETLNQHDDMFDAAASITAEETFEEKPKDASFKTKDHSNTPDVQQLLASDGVFSEWTSSRKLKNQQRLNIKEEPEDSWVQAADTPTACKEPKSALSVNDDKQQERRW